MGLIDVEYLFDFADQIGAKIRYVNLQKSNPELFAYTKPPFIYLDASLRDNPRLYKCVLAEEIGHVLYPPRPGHIAFHTTGYIHISHIKKSNINAVVAQDERQALDWATGVLMPDVEFWRAIENGVNTVYELAEYFEVEPWLALHKIRYIRRKARHSGRKLNWRDLINF